MSYPIETRLAPKSGYFTPEESNAHYRVRYDRSTVLVHWWGDGTGAANHDNIVNYMNNQAAAGTKSVNYVVSDNKITMCVHPDNVAWCSGPQANPISVSIECQPTLGPEGYKKVGWLVSELEKRYNRTMAIQGHNAYMATACPGSIQLNKIRYEADNFKRGAGDEMINTREEATVMYQMLRPHGPITEPELAGTVGRRSFAQFCRDAMPEIAARNNALTAQAAHLYGLQGTIDQLNSKIHEMLKLEAMEDVDEAAKSERIHQLTMQVGILTDDLEKTTNRLNELSKPIIHPETASPVTETPAQTDVEAPEPAVSSQSVQSSPSWFTKLVADLVTLFVPKKTP